MKKCSKCLQMKSLDLFGLRKSARDGLRGACKACLNRQKKECETDSQRERKRLRSAEYRSIPEKAEMRKAYAAIYRSKKRQEIAKKNADYRDKNRDAIRSASRDYYQRNKGKILEYFSSRKKEKSEYDRMRVEAKKPLILAKSAEWKRNNRDKLKIQASRRRARKLGADGHHTLYDIEKILSDQAYRCRYCGACLNSRYHLDHRQPLARGGSNWPSNLQALCAPCNVRKWAKDPDVFEREIGFIS